MRTTGDVREHLDERCATVNMMHLGAGVPGMSTATASRMDGDAWFINRVLVDEQHRGKGVGGGILRRLLTLLFNRGRASEVIVTPDGYGSDPARLVAFYERNGFRKLADGAMVCLSPPTIWVNIISACNACPLEVLEELVEKLGPVPIGPELFGMTLGYELRGEDLYAEIRDVPGLERYARAAAITTRGPGGFIEVHGVVMTNASREELRGMARGIVE